MLCVIVLGETYVEGPLLLNVFVFTFEMPGYDFPRAPKRAHKKDPKAVETLPLRWWTDAPSMWRHRRKLRLDKAWTHESLIPK